MKRNKFVILFFALLISLFTFASLVCGPLQNVLQRWTKSLKYIDKENMMDNLEIRATYYSAEFIMLTQNEAKQPLD